SAAYDVIDDETRRREYDQARAMGPMGAAGRGGFRFDGARMGAADLGDLLGNLFGRGESGPSTGPFSRGPQRGMDLEADLHISFLDAIHGATTSVNLVSEVN